jgi:hypothetical protein
MEVQKRRKTDTYAHTTVSIVMVICSTIVACAGHLEPEAMLASWGIAAGVIGSPIVVRKGSGEQ